MKTEHHITFGQIMARQIFAKRGSHTEAHLSEVELAAMLAIAFECGYDHPNISAETRSAERGAL